MTIDEWIDELKHGDLDAIKDRLDAVELVRFLEELERSRRFTSEYCGQNRTMDQCFRCALYDYGLCVDRDLAIKCRERVKSL